MIPAQSTGDSSGDYIEQKWIKAGGDVIGKLVLQLPTPPPTALHSLPAPPALFVGRGGQGGELEVLLAALDPARASGAAPGTGEDTEPDDSSAGVVVSALAGMGGVGKTALALAAGAIAHHQEWFCAQLFVDLRGYTPGAAPLSAEAALDVLLRQMGVPLQDIPPGVQERASFYRSALAGLSRADERHRPVLVVADNTRSAAQVRPLLPGLGRHRLLATSRSGLHSLTGARHLDLGVLDPGAAIALLASALRSGNPRDPRAADEAGLGRLAGLCGQLPLALEIIAAQLAHDNELTPDELATQLKEAVSLVDEVTDPDQETDQARVLRAVFDTSLHHLPPDQVRVFLLVACAPGPSTSTAAAAVLTGLPPGKVRKVLVALAAAHLLTRPASGRWGTHDLLADHARTHPHPSQDRNQALGRLLDHYTATTGAADAHLRALPGQVVPKVFPGREAALGWLDAERATLVAAALAAAALEHTEAAIALPLHLAQHLDRRRSFEEWEKVSRSAQETARTTGDQANEAQAWNNLGLALRQVRRLEEAIDAHQRARDLHQQVGDAHGEAMAWNNLGLALQQVRRFEEAIKAHIHDLNYCQQVGDAHSEAMAWNNLGTALQQVRRFDEAIDAHIHDLNYCQQVGDAHGEARAWNNLGSALGQVRRLEEAIKAHQRARDLHQQVGDAHGEARAWNNLGSSLRQVRRFDEAIKAHQRAREAFQHLGDAHGEAQAWNNLGLVLVNAGGKGEAMETLTRAVDLFEATGDTQPAAIVRELIARIQEGQVPRIRPDRPG